MAKYSLNEVLKARAAQNKQAKLDGEEMALDDIARVKVLSPARQVFKRFIRNRLAVFGSIVLITMFVFSFLGPLFYAYGQKEIFYKYEGRNIRYGMCTETQTYTDYVINDGVNLAEQIITRTKVAKNELLATGKVTIGEDAAVEVKNERLTGDIKITKTVVSSTDADHEKAFTFTITLPGDEGATVNGDFEAAGVEGITTVTFTDGEATVELKDGDTLTIKGLPVGVDYVVAEEEADQGGFVTTKANDEGSIKETTAADVKFTNTRSEGSLIIHKAVVSKLPADLDPEETKYTITITLDDTTITNKYGNVQFTDGVATVELGHDESVTIKGLPADIGYTVSEEAPENFEEPEIEGAEGTIVKDDTKKADITNTRKTGDLTITKTVESEFAADKEKSFEFTITLDPAIEDSFDTVDGEGAEGSITFNSKGVATVNLMDGESLTIKGLPVTVTYTVEETDDPEFDTTKTGDTGEITAAEAAEGEGETTETEGEGETTEAEGTKAEFTNTRKVVEVSVEKVWEDEDNKYGKQPESITVKLMADGKAYKDENGDEVTVELNSGNEWKYTFENLPEVVGTKTVKYTVEEDMETVPAGYTNKVTGSAENGFTITNTFKPVDTDPPVGKVIIGDEPAEPSSSPSRRPPPIPSLRCLKRPRSRSWAKARKSSASSGSPSPAPMSTRSPRSRKTPKATPTTPPSTS